MMAKKSIKGNASRVPPEPGTHADVEKWMSRVMPDLNPVVKKVDELIREAHDELQYAVKWRKAYYGLPKRGWIVELVAYDVSVNVVFLGGADLEPPPPLGETGRSRYVKVRTVEEVDTPEMRKWIAQAGDADGWS